MTACGYCKRTDELTGINGRWVCPDHIADGFRPVGEALSAIRRFTEDRIDPLTGKPWVLCGNAVRTVRSPDNRRGMSVCTGCLKPATLDADGLWIYE
jgi:hypothetical protein